MSSVYVLQMKSYLISLEMRQQQVYETITESIYMMKFFMNNIFLKRKLYTLGMNEGTKFSNHLIYQLASMEIKLDDEDKTITLLSFTSWILKSSNYIYVF